MMDQIMLDLETLDSRETAVILSIGAVRFDLTSGELGEEFYLVIDPENCQKYGLTVSSSTVAWWMSQDKEAQKVFTDVSVSLPMALKEFTFYVNEVAESMVWGNGSTFDNMIMRNAYRACDLLLPWPFRNDLCFRTMKTVFRSLYEESKEEGEVRHNSLDDAKRQAKSLIHIMKGLKRL